nr:uncharacterized protein LOC108067524 [Drosophila takahashii]
MHFFKLVALGFLFYYAEGCEVFCSRNYRPVCGFDGTCHMERRNSCLMKSLNCRRATKGKPVFKNIRNGACSKSLERCKADANNDY